MGTNGLICLIKFCILLYQFIHLIIFSQSSIELIVLAMIKQFLSDVYWKDVEYLVIDTPPGKSVIRNGFKAKVNF